MLRLGQRNAHFVVSTITRQTCTTPKFWSCKKSTAMLNFGSNDDLEFMIYRLRSYVTTKRKAAPDCDRGLALLQHVSDAQLCCSHQNQEHTWLAKN